MKNTILNTLAIVLLSTLVAFAQSNEEGEISITDQDKFIALSQVDNIVSQGARNQSSLSEGVNSIFIQQIGTDNVVFSNIIAESSDIKIVQNGDQNTVEINESAREIEKAITQNGNNNSVVDFSFNSEISTNLQLIQEGDNLIFERFGGNELSKNLKFKMSGDAKTIIVRSF
ncbi:hypothetical protein [Aquimarina mytili]|uniref:Curlin associated repeat-containing protein n=1 Tax=Aquimarina mytili TaxID=874423 RepID=A0A936ZZD3_9FLAO|nr:hypothetical protein [Aquimarina mytili]MBL0684773.1 hypothetical protein [Aquimarina mytili]